MKSRQKIDNHAKYLTVGSFLKGKFNKKYQSQKNREIILGNLIKNM